MKTIHAPSMGAQSVGAMSTWSMRYSEPSTSPLSTTPSTPYTFRSTITSCPSAPLSTTTTSSSSTTSTATLLTKSSYATPLSSSLSSSNTSVFSTMEAAENDVDGLAGQKAYSLKSALRSKVDTDIFWEVLMSGLVDIAGAQCAFVSRSTVDVDYEPASNDEHPSLASTDLQAVITMSVCSKDGKTVSHIHPNQHWEIEGLFCEDKVILIPHSLPSRHPHMSNNFIGSGMEAYLSIPLWQGSTHIGFYGLLWTAEGLQNRPRLSWGYLTTFLSALEDLVQTRVLKDLKAPGDGKFDDVPLCCKLSFRPYAHIISHELRTPLQGVVGMLDSVHGSLTELCQTNSCLGAVIKPVLQDIETGQDSAMRAIYAADNMVHAYDLDTTSSRRSSARYDTGRGFDKMQRDIPTALDAVLAAEDDQLRPVRKRAPSPTPYPVPANNLDPVNSINIKGRQRSWSNPSPPEYAALHPSPRRAKLMIPIVGAIPPFSPSSLAGSVVGDETATNIGNPQRNTYPVNLREFLRDMIHDCLKLGGRPDSIETNETEHGEVIMVQIKGSQRKTRIEFLVDYEVPNFIIVDKLSLKKLLTGVFHNSIKFAEGCTISLAVSITQRLVKFTITDTGQGICAMFVDRLFQPYSRQDDSITSRMDGLGLGLMVARGLARKMGGDVWLQHTATEGVDKGSQFCVQIPVTPTNLASSLPGTPFFQKDRYISGSFSPSYSTAEATQHNDHVANNPTSYTETTISSLRVDARRIVPILPKGNSLTLRPSSHLISPFIPSSSSPLSLVTFKPCSATNVAPLLRSQSGTEARELASSRPTLRSVHTSVPPEKPFLSSPAEIPDGKPATIGSLFPALRVLVVEDNTINRRLLVNMLKRLGISEANIFSACDGLEAIKIVQDERADEDGYISLILMDIWMPNCDGYEATKQIYKIAKGREVFDQDRRSVTIVGVSADVTGEAARRALEVGMVGFVAKPFRLTHLEKILRDHVSDGL